MLLTISFDFDSRRDRPSFTLFPLNFDATGGMGPPSPMFLLILTQEKGASPPPPHFPSILMQGRDGTPSIYISLDFNTRRRDPSSTTGPSPLL